MADPRGRSPGRNVATAAAALSLTVNAAAGPLQVTTLSPLPVAIVGQPYTVTFTASGGTPPYKFLTTVLPSWAKLNQGTGVLTGTPVAGQEVFVLLYVRDSTNAQTPLGNMFIPMYATPTVLVPLHNPPAAIAGQSYSATLTASGGTPPYTWSAAGLPSGLTLSPAGVVSGTVAIAGMYRFNVTATDASSPGIASRAAPLLLAVQSSSSNWNNVTCIDLRSTVTAATDPAYCAPLIAASDLTPPIGMNHVPPYDGLYRNSPLVSAGNTFAAGWVHTGTGASPWPSDYARNFAGVTDGRIGGGHLPNFVGGGTLKWQVGTAPGQYRIWLAAYSRVGFRMTIRDSSKTLGTVAIPATAMSGDRPSEIVGADGTLYTTVANWAAASTYGGNPITITTTDASNGRGGPYLYFDCGQAAAGLAYVAAQAVGPSSKIPGGRENFAVTRPGD